MPAKTSLLATLISLGAPIFLVLSPITSYADQILSMHRARSSAGFSLDIPLIMLSASILKIFYWPGARFDLSLLIQAVVMVVVQTLLLKVALDNRQIPLLRHEAIEMKLGARSPNMDALGARRGEERDNSGRPYDFWRWRAQRPYWNFILALAGGLFTLHIFLQPAPGYAQEYTTLLGALGLGIEALLPIPQLWQTYSSQSC